MIRQALPMRPLVTLLALVLLVSSMAFSGGILDGTLRAFSKGSHIMVEWTTEGEFNATRFTIERKAGMSGTFILLTNDPEKEKLTQSRWHYWFEDKTAFRTTDNIYQYRITSLESGQAYYVTVNHSVSSVRRTWGSIKAMFR